MFRKVMNSTSRILGTAAVALTLATGIASAEEPKVLGRYKHWSAFTMDQGGSKVCFIVADPRSKKLSRRGRNRGDVFFMVTHWPGEKTFGQPSVIIGYPFGPNSTPTVRVGSDKFNMVLDADNEENKNRAWIADNPTEQRLLDAMKRGNNMIIT